MDVHERETSIDQIKSNNITSLNILVVVIIVIGLIFMGVSLFTEWERHWMEGPAIAIMVIFIPLTALSYLRYKLPKKQDEFESVKKALKFESTNSELFSTLINQHNSESDYFLPVCFVSFFSLLGFYILMTSSGQVLFSGMDWIASASTGDLIDGKSYRRGVVAIGIAFLGAYVWSIQYIFRRMVTLDLPPGAYYSIGSRMVYSAFLAVIFQHFLFSMSTVDNDFLARQLIPTSFLIGIFPERALSYMKDKLGHLFSKKEKGTSPLPLEMIEGISGFHKARLAELGIDNIQNLAHSSLMELILKTPLNPRMLIDWMVQARLCLEFRENTAKIRSAGVRTILDLQEIADSEELIAKLATNSGVEHSIIQTICEANRDEKSIDRLRLAYDVLNII